VRRVESVELDQPADDEARVHRKGRAEAGRAGLLLLEPVVYTFFWFELLE
jgi:hypothetical protein